MSKVDNQKSVFVNKDSQLTLPQDQTVQLPVSATEWFMNNQFGF